VLVVRMGAGLRAEAGAHDGLLQVDARELPAGLARALWNDEPPPAEPGPLPIPATPDLWVKYPCSVGNTWQTSHQGAVVNWEVLATSESVTVPDGTYSCIHIRGTSALTGRTYADHWYCVGTGWIKMTQGALNIELIDKDI